MNLDEANEWVIRAAIRRLGPEARLDPAKLQEQLGEIVRQHGEEIFGKLSEEARGELRRQGRSLKAQEVRLRRIDEAIAYGCWLIARYGAETLGELPLHEQAEFSRLWSLAAGAAKADEN